MYCAKANAEVTGQVRKVINHFRKWYIVMKMIKNISNCKNSRF